MKRRILIIVIILSLIFFNIDIFYKTYANSQSLTQNINNTDENLDNNNIDSSVENYSEAALLLDVNADKILYEKNARVQMYPASTTKLMTAILTLEKCPDLSKKATVSYYAVHSVPYTYSIANLQPGEQISLSELLDALMIASANDAAFVLAEYIAEEGVYPIDSSQNTKNIFNMSIAAFSDMMNEKALEIGCQNTCFVNPNGIHNNEHYSTAYDLALIGKYAYTNSKLMAIAQKQSSAISNTNIYNGEQRTFKATNLLILNDKSLYYEYANGLKTGYTDAAQYCMIASAKKGDRNLIAVVLHSDNCTNLTTSRESDCKRLFEYGFNNFSNTTLVSQNEISKNLTIINGTKESRNLNLLCESTLQTLIKNDEVLDVTPEIKITKRLAPISQGEIIGSITYVVDGITYSSNLIAEHDVEPTDYLSLIYTCLVLFASLLLIFTIIFELKRRKK